MLTPKPRGPLSQRLCQDLTAGRVGEDLLEASRRAAGEAVARDDAQIALWTLYELHHGGFEDVAEDLEWHTGLLALRQQLEAGFLAELTTRYERAAVTEPSTEQPFAERLLAYVAGLDGPSLAHVVQREATREQALDVLRALSLGHLKEADPTTWVIPRISGAAKAALVELQYDEYGAGVHPRHHARLFADALAACRLDPAYGAYVDDVPVEVLELNNALALFGLHRRWRGAAVGFLAALETTGSLQARPMANGLRRVGLAEEMVDYFAEHVAADAVHEQLAVRRICAPLVEAEPQLLDDVFLGAFTCVDLERRLARALLDGSAS